jgi:outer membrane protein OmpA-like peptidoglycan-associated protein
MPASGKGRRQIALLALAMMFATPYPVLFAEPAATTDDMVKELSGLEAGADIDVPALRQQVVERVKSKANPVALKRPPVAPQLARLPHLNLDITFNPDSPVIRPDSYRTLGRVADALADPRLSSFGFLIVGHTDSSGRREENLTLSQRRADSFRDVLVTTFKISSKRIQSIGLGEEQLLDADRPKAPVNQQVQIVTVRKLP